MGGWVCKCPKFFWVEKNWAGGVFREKGLGAYTSPTLMIEESSPTLLKK